jgi:glycosyltransferase involved in cell wall biosynthesis
VKPLRVLILGRDPDVFSSDGRAANDTHERHLCYVKELQRRSPGSEVRIITHTRRPGKAFEAPIPGMQIYGTNSQSRFHCPFDLARLMRSFAQNGWIPDVVSCQTGYEEAPIAFCVADRSSRVQVQVHSRFYGDAFAHERLAQRIQRGIIRWSIRRCDQARVVARGIARDLISSGDIEEDRIALAPVPITFQAHKRKADPNCPVMLFVGRLVSAKDLGLWCDVAEIVHRAIPQAEFWVVGEGPDRELLERRMPAFDGKMRLFGAVAYSDLAEIYSRASVFLLSSAYEGLGRVVVEAMQAKVPVVATDIVGPRDLIEDGRTGRLISRVPSALAEAVIEILTQPELARRMAAAALAWARANYDQKEVTAKLVQSWEVAAALPKRRP